MHLDELHEIRRNFTLELQEAASGQQTSLPFVIHYIPEIPFVKEGEEFFVLVIGGSVFQHARCKLENGQIIILRKINGQNPPFHTSDEFFEFVADKVPTDIKHLALNFAFPLQPTVHEGTPLDGVLINATKEYSFSGLVGKQVGKEVSIYLKQKRGQEVVVGVANDTICELLSGISNVTKPEYLACGIVGTGINFAFFLDSKRAVNLEAANFNKFGTSKYAQIIDKDSATPGSALFEKEVSGGYLYQHFNLFADEKGLALKIPSSLELDEYAKRCDIGEDGETCKFASELLDRSAAMVAAQVAGITAFKQSDMNFIMAGSLFWKAFQYKETVSRYVKQLIPEFNVSFIAIESCEIYGGAKLVS